MTVKRAIDFTEKLFLLLIESRKVELKDLLMMFIYAGVPGREADAVVLTYESGANL